MTRWSTLLVLLCACDSPLARAAPAGAPPAPSVRNTPTATRTWHTLVATLRGKKLTVELDGKRTFEKTLDAAPTGRVGLWSKADSQVLFDEFRVERL